ncbi:MAG: DeoR/GlpR transcriptional regulator, partial [Sedimentisphaerales bacterium]|nr:DeoR/GlpR transcriptional regulator [Sedimentisphaerales bacterium]
MLIEERLEGLLKAVNDRRSITVQEACRLFNLSRDTVRRDFIRLSEMGLVMRTHGGIVSRKNAIYEYASRVENALVQNHGQKEAIARRAVALISQGDSIILDGGTTTYEIAKLLGEYTDLTVLTYGLNIAFELAKYEHISAILFGGILSRQAMAILGPDSIAMIRNYHANKLFLAANAVTLDKGLMTPNRLQADVKKELVKIANEVIVVADSSKINKTALFAFCAL